VAARAGYHRVLRVARTLADLDGAEKFGRIHLAEALSYRALADERGGQRAPLVGAIIVATAAVEFFWGTE